MFNFGQIRLTFLDHGCAWLTMVDHVDYFLPWVPIIDYGYVAIIMFISIDLCRITIFFHGCVTWKHPSRVLLHCDGRQGFCSFVTFPNSYVTLWHSYSLTYVKLNMVDHGWPWWLWLTMVTMVDHGDYDYLTLILCHIQK